MIAIIWPWQTARHNSGGKIISTEMGQFPLKYPPNCPYFKKAVIK